MSLVLLDVMLKNNHITQDIYDLYSEGLTSERKEKPEFIVIDINGESSLEIFSKKLRKLANELGLRNKKYDDLQVKFDILVINDLVYDLLSYYSKQGYLCDTYLVNCGSVCYMQYRLTNHKARKYHADGKLVHYCKKHNDDDTWYMLKFDI